MNIEDANSKYNYLKINNRLVFVDDNNKVLFGGLLYNIKPTYSDINTFYFENMLGLFNDKILYQDRNFVNISIDTIMQDILSEVNGREQTYITLDCGIEDTTSKEFDRNDKVYSVFKELLDNKYEFTIMPVLEATTVSFVLSVKDSIGIDRT